MFIPAATASKARRYCPTCEVAWVSDGDQPRCWLCGNVSTLRQPGHITSQASMSGSNRRLSWDDDQLDDLTGASVP